MMMRQEVLSKNDVVTSMISIFGVDTCSLINLVATHSFTSHSLVKQMEKPIPLNSTIEISTPIEESLWLM